MVKEVVVNHVWNSAVIPLDIIISMCEQSSPCRRRQCPRTMFTRCVQCMPMSTQGPCRAARGRVCRRALSVVRTLKAGLVWITDDLGWPQPSLFQGPNNFEMCRISRSVQQSIIHGAGDIWRLEWNWQQVLRGLTDNTVVIVNTLRPERIFFRCHFQFSSIRSAISFFHEFNWNLFTGILLTMWQDWFMVCLWAGDGLLSESVTA